MTLRAKHAFKYNRVRLSVGDEFEPKSERDAKLLVGVGRAETVETAAKREERDVKRGRKKYSTKVAEPVETPVEPPPTVEEPAADTESDRFYSRRDLQAE